MTNLYADAAARNSFAARSSAATLPTGCAVRCPGTTIAGNVTGRSGRWVIVTDANGKTHNCTEAELVRA